jgi:tape measure domain-containing protein
MAAGDTRRLRVVVTGDSGDAQQSLEQVGQAADEAQSKIGMVSAALVTWAARGAIALGAIGAAAATMGVQTAMQLEQVEVGFTTMLGSATKAQKFMKELQAFAAATPFEFTELVGSAQRFLAMGFAAKEVIPMLTAVGDAVAAMGGSAESVDSVTRALGQMQAKGKVSGEELMQLTEQGIPALKILADQYGVSTTKMSKMIEKGQVMSDKAIPALIDGLRNGTSSVKGFGGMMEKQSATMQGKWSTFMDTLRMGLGNIATKFMPQMKSGLESLSGATANFFAGIQGKGPLAAFGKTMASVVETVKRMVKAFKDGDAVSGSWRGALELLAVIFRGFLETLQWMGEAVATAVRWFREHEAVTKTLLITLGALVALTKLHAIVTGVQAAGGIMAMVKSMTLVQSVTKVATAVQWAYTGAIAAAQYLQIAGYLGILAIKTKLLAAWTKIQTAAQWLWNLALNANPIGLIIAGIALLVGAFVLLWKNNEGFRNFILTKLWPAIKTAFEAIKKVVMFVVDAIVSSFIAFKNDATSIWNAIASVVSGVARGIYTFLSPVINLIIKIGSVLTGFYVGVWKIIWIAVQIAVKIFVQWFMTYAMPIIRNTIAVIVAIVRSMGAVFKIIWNAILGAVKFVVNWFTGTALPAIRAFVNGIKSDWNKFSAFASALWTAIKMRVQQAFQAIAGPIAAILSAGIAKFKGFINGFKAVWNSIFDSVGKKTKGVMDGVVKGFNMAKDGIKKAWDKIQGIVKAPINFVINDVYNNRVLPLWNNVAAKFGVGTRLDKIKGFAKGGIYAGYSPGKDTINARLSPGEGVAVPELVQQIGAKRFLEWNKMARNGKAIAQYSTGGIANFKDGGIFGGAVDFGKKILGKGKDFIQGIAAKAVNPLVDIVRRFINSNMSTDGVSGLLRAGGNTILDKFTGWVKGKDKEAPAIGGGGIAGGYRTMQALISRQFPGLRMISGYRPGSRTLSGNTSYHARGRAVDYAPVRALAQWIRSTYGAKTKELITPFQELNLHNGRPHRYTGAVWNQHNWAGGNAHNHWAMDTASTVPPGWFTGYNGTGKPETLVNSDMIGKGSGVTIEHLEINVYGDVPQTQVRKMTKDIRDELLTLGRRNGGRNGLATT